MNLCISNSVRPDTVKSSVTSFYGDDKVRSSNTSLPESITTVLNTLLRTCRAFAGNGRQFVGFAEVARSTGNRSDGTFGAIIACKTLASHALGRTLALGDAGVALVNEKSMHA